MSRYLNFTLSLPSLGLRFAKAVPFLRLKYLVLYVGLAIKVKFSSTQVPRPNPLKPKLIKIVLKNSVHTAKETHHFTITTIFWSTMFKEMIAVYSKNHTKSVNTKYSIIYC